MTTKLQVLITGSNGNLGTRLISRLKAMEIVDAHAVTRVNGDFDFNTLNKQIDDLGENEKVLVHLAWNTLDRSHEAQQKCVRQTAEIAEVCNTRGVRMIFVSSMSSHENARSKYGEGKFCAEKEVQKRGGCVIRPGFVLMSPAAGLQNMFRNPFLRMFNIRFVSPELFVPVITEQNFLESMCEQIKNSPNNGDVKMHSEWIPLGRVGGYLQNRSGKQLNVRIKTRFVSKSIHVFGFLNRRVRELEDSFTGLVDINK